MPSSPFCSLASTCLVLPAEATSWPSNHAVHGKGGAKRPFSPSAQVLARVLLAFSVTRGWCLQQPPPSCFMSFTSIPPVRFGLSTQRWGRGEPAPTQFLSGFHRQDPGPGMDYGGGEVCGSPCLCRSCGLAPYKHLCRMRAPCGTRWRATWEEGKACLEACHTA